MSMNHSEEASLSGSEEASLSGTAPVPRFLFMQKKAGRWPRPAPESGPCFSCRFLGLTLDAAGPALKPGLLIDPP